MISFRSSKKFHQLRRCFGDKNHWRRIHWYKLYNALCNVIIPCIPHDNPSVVQISRLVLSNYFKRSSREIRTTEEVFVGWSNDITSYNALLVNFAKFLRRSENLSSSSRLATWDFETSINRFWNLLIAIKLCRIYLWGVTKCSVIWSFYEFQDDPFMIRISRLDRVLVDPSTFKNLKWTVIANSTHHHLISQQEVSTYSKCQLSISSISGLGSGDLNNKDN